MSDPDQYFTDCPLETRCCLTFNCVICQLLHCIPITLKFFFIFEVFFISRHDNLSRCECGGLLFNKSVFCVDHFRCKKKSDNR